MHVLQNYAVIKSLILCFTLVGFTIFSQPVRAFEDDEDEEARHANDSAYMHVQCASRPLACEHHYNKMIPPNTNYHQMEEKDRIKCTDVPSNETYSKYCPLRILITMDILHIKNIDEDIGRIQLLMVFRQKWTDRRLELPPEFSDNCPLITEVNNNTASYEPRYVRNEVWMPDAYINGVESVFHPVLLHKAESFHIDREAFIKYNLFGVFSLSCPMDFALFPMDVQYCPMYIESWRLDHSLQQLMWGEESPIGLISDYKLNQFSFSVRVLKVTKKVYSTGNYSQLGVVLIFSRELQFYILQIYFPTVLFVIISGLSITIPLKYAQGRIILTITTMLTLAALFSLVSMNSPSTSYIKAIDIWMFVCLVFVFAAVVECLVEIRLAFVVSQAYKRQHLGFFTPVSVALVENKEVFGAFFGTDDDDADFFDAGSVHEPEPASAAAPAASDHAENLDAVEQPSQRRVTFKEPDPTPAPEAKPNAKRLTYEERWSRAAQLFERCSVIIYPVAFLVFNIVYWSYYLTAARPPEDLAQQMREGYTPEPRTLEPIPDGVL